MSHDIAVIPDLSGIEQALISGDLSQLTPEQRLVYYRRVCESLGLNPLTKPFEYLRLNGRLVLYATRSCADQLRQIHGVSTEIVSQQHVGDLYVVHVRAKTRDGRVDEDLGIVSTKGLTGDALANAILKAVTKAKRRVTLSVCGLGWLDETEVETITDAEQVSENEPAPQPAAEQPSTRDARLERGRAILRRMRERENFQRVPVRLQLEWLAAQGWLGLEITRRIESGEATDDEIASALAALDDAKLRKLGRFCDEQAAR